MPLGYPLVAHPGHHHDTPTVPLHQLEIIGESEQDDKIRALQKRLAASPSDAPSLEKLAWLLIAKARSETDHSLYGPAKECAKKLIDSDQSKAEGQLILGHLLLQQHQFAKAREVALSLTKERGWHYDYGLLGDILLDLGDTTGATEAYEQMMQQRPGLESYARAALIRWQRGHLDDAVAAMELAVSAGSLRQPEPIAWAGSKLTLLYLQQGELSRAHVIADRALSLVPEYPHALLARGRTLMAEERFAEALPDLKRASSKLEEPAFLWALEDCLRSLDVREADGIAEQLHATGESADPRTYALYLATHRRDTSRALSLALAELEQRQDILTHDAVAWAAFANGDLTLAQESMKKALADGTRDPRLALHAAAIAKAAGDHDKAIQFYHSAERERSLLLPSEQTLLNDLHTQLHAES